MKNILKKVACAVMAVAVMSPVTAFAQGKSNASNASSTSNTSQAKKATSSDKSLVIYSTHPEEMLTKVTEEFTKKTGITVEFVNLKGELAQRVKSEKDNPQADIMYGGASSLFIQMEKEGLFEKVEPTWAKDLKEGYKSKDNTWFGTMQTPVVMFYNKDKVKPEEAPKSWADLANDQFKGKIVSRDAGSSSQKAAIVALRDYFTNNGDEAKALDFLKKLDQNTLNYYKNGGLHFQAVGKGEAPISYAVLSAVNDNVTKNEMPLETIVPEEGAIIILDGIAAIKNAPHKEAAAQFIEFAGSPEVQNMLAKEFGRMPILESALTDVPEYMKQPIKAMNIDWYKLSENESKWTEEWTTNIKDAAKDIKEGN